MRLPSSQKSLLAFALIAGFGFVATLYVMPSAGSDPALSSDPLVPEEGPMEEITVPTEGATARPVPPLPSSTGAPGTTPSSGVGAGPYRGYALSLAELRGLSPDYPPGTRLQLWVSWEPPITKHPRVQRLPGVVVLEEIVQPLTPEGPVSVELLIPAEELPGFLFAHKYGSLSAVAITP